MDATTALGLLSWGVALYLWRNGARLHQISRTIRGMSTFSVPLASKAVYTLLGVLVGSTVFVGIALADGANPFDHFQRVLQAPIKITPAPLSTPTLTPLATLTPLPTPTAIPSSTLWITATLRITPTLPANTPQAQITPEGGQGWEKTPNGQGQGQFQTPPGQGGVPPGQQKQTDEPKPPKDNSGNGSGKK